MTKTTNDCCGYWIGEAFNAANAPHYTSANLRQIGELEIKAMFGRRCEHCRDCRAAVEITRPDL